MSTAGGPTKALSAKLVHYFVARNEGGVHDDIIHVLRRADSKKGQLRLYLELRAEERTSQGCSSLGYNIKVLKVQSNVPSLYGDRLLDCSDRLLPLVKVKFSPSAGRVLDHRMIQELSCKGFTFLQEQFHFFAFKDLGTEFAYFVPLARTGHSDAVSLWQKVAKFAELSQVPLLGMRLGLLVSGACFGFCMNDRDVHIRELEDEFLSAGSRDTIVTGGCWITISNTWWLFDYMPETSPFPFRFIGSLPH